VAFSACQKRDLIRRVSATVAAHARLWMDLPVPLEPEIWIHQNGSP
jgi:hypothetical protein